MWLTYTTEFNFKHSIRDRPELEDKTCCTLHQHDNVKVLVKVKSTEKFLDFKLLKSVVNGILIYCETATLNTAMNTDDATMENFARWLSSRIGSHFRDVYKYRFPNGGVRLIIQETPKYGVEL